MSSTTNLSSGGIVTFDIKTSGNTIPDTMDVLSIEIEQGVNKIPTAKIFILDGPTETGSFEVSSSSTFVPGNTVTIEAGYDTKNEVIFKGIITKQSISIDRAQGSFLTVECHDVAVKMSVGRKSMTFSKQTDSDIMSSIIGTYSGLSAEVSSTKKVWQEQVQYYTTDWDFLLSRAETNGMIVTALNNKVSVLKPDAYKTSVLNITYDDNLLAFNAELNAVTQLDNAEARAWNYKTQKTITGQATNSNTGPGNLSTKKLSEVVGLSEYQLQSTAPLETEDLTNWSEATLVKSAFSKIQGEATFHGSALAEPGKNITLAGLGERFNGDHIISSVHHTIEHGNWITEVSIGLSPIWFTQEPEVMAPPASGLLPGVQGLFNATVKKMHEDPDNQFRVLVDIPLFDNKGEGLWARLTNFYSTAGAGAFFMPEVGDEVVVGFLNEDPRYPIILGSMYSTSKNKPAAGLEPNENNTIKAFVSKSGINIAFDDEKKVLTLETPGKNTVILSDNDKEITIKDQNNNSIIMSESGMTIKSAKNISIEATQNLTLKGTQGVTIESSGGDVEISGLNIKNSADVQFSAEGGATASLIGGTETTIQGAMVMIN